MYGSRRRVSSTYSQCSAKRVLQPWELNRRALRVTADRSAAAELHRSLRKGRNYQSARHSPHIPGIGPESSQAWVGVQKVVVEEVQCV